MAVTNQASGTCVDEIAERIYRIHTPVKDVPGGFSFNQYLIEDEQPLLFHTGPRRLFPLVCEAVTTVLRPERLCFVAFSHYESDECGSLNQWLMVAPRAAPVCSRVNALINGDTFDRTARPLADGELLDLGQHRLVWLDTPHLPHAWECGYMMEQQTRTLLCGDLFTQGGLGTSALTADDILGPSESFRAAMDYYSHTRNARSMLDRLAACAPATLACMHGSAWRGDGAGLLRALATSFGQ